MATKLTGHDLLIRGGAVIDGTRSPRFSADVAVREDRIVAVGDLSTHTARRTIDARGKIVAPGFIDSHTHDDEALLCQPDMEFKVSQGVTTVVTGNCGISMAPTPADVLLPAPLTLISGSERFPTFAAYLDALRMRPAAVNVVPMVGHTNFRVMTMDDLTREANDSEVRQMRELLEEALDAGAVGMSTGTYYPPAAAATTEEVIGVARSLASYGALYAAHMRNEAERSLDALEETFHIGREIGAPVVISHHKLATEETFGKSVVTLQRIKEEMACSCVSLDCYPYAAASSMLHADEERLKGRVVIASCKEYPGLQGKDLQDIADGWGISRAEAAKRLQPATAIYFIMDEQDVRRILEFERTMIGSDGLPGLDRPHPRLWGTFPRVLGRYSREIKLFPLETAVWKMTGLTAENFSLERRGVIAVGNYADITIFDEHSVYDMADYENPTAPSVGIDEVIVNGLTAYRQGLHMQSRSGRVLSRVAGSRA